MTEETECRCCEASTTNTGTELCDQCWELEHRMLKDPDLTLKILLGSDTIKDLILCDLIKLYNATQNELQKRCGWKG